MIERVAKEIFMYQSFRNWKKREKAIQLLIQLKVSMYALLYSYKTYIQLADDLRHVQFRIAYSNTFLLCHRHGPTTPGDISCRAHDREKIYELYFNEMSEFYWNPARFNVKCHGYSDSDRGPIPCSMPAIQRNYIRVSGYASHTLTLSRTPSLHVISCLTEN